MLKRIMAMMMVMMTTFGSVTANAAKRDVEIDVHLDNAEVVTTIGPVFIWNKFESFYMLEAGERVEGVEHTAKEFMLKYAELHDMTDINKNTVCVRFGEIACKYDNVDVYGIYFIYRNRTDKTNKIVYVNDEDFWEVIYAIGL